MGAWTVSQRKILVDVQLHNMHFEHVSVHILPERPEIMHHALHLYGTFEHARWSYRFRSYWGEPSDAEFVRFITIAPQTFPARDGILADSECKAVSARPDLRMADQ